MAASAAIFSSDIASLLISTLDSIVDDKAGYKAKDFKLWMDVRSMDKQYIDDQEWGGPGLAYEVSEGETIPTGDIRVGATTRYLARKFGLRLNITEEAIEDCKYEQVIDAGARLARALQKSIEVDTHALLNNGFSTSYPIGDGLPVWSASHTLPGGVGTWSNLMSTPVSPSRIAVITATTAIAKIPGHDGTIEGYKPKAVLCPYDQWATWEGLIRSEKTPENNFNEVNVVKGMGLKIHPLVFWDASTTNWAMLTDAPKGFRFLWRRKPKSRTWVENSNEVMSHVVSARWCHGITDARGTYGVNA